MKETNTMTSFLEVLERQTILIDQLARDEAELQRAVADRDWACLEDLVPRMAQLGEEINDAEATRNELLADLAASLGHNLTFSQVLARIPAEVRTGLSERYRALKIAVLRLQSRTSTMDAYLRSVIGTTRGVLRELYPEQMEHRYSRTGHGQFSGATAMMVDSSL